MHCCRYEIQTKWNGKSNRRHLKQVSGTGRRVTWDHRTIIAEKITYVGSFLVPGQTRGDDSGHTRYDSFLIGRLTTPPALLSLFLLVEIYKEKHNWVWLTVTFPPPPPTAQASTKRCNLVELGRLAKSIVEMKQSEKFTRQSIIHPCSNSLIPTKVRFQKYNRTSALWTQRKNKNVCRTDATDVPIKLFHAILQPGVLSWHQYDVSRNETGQTSSNDTMNNSQ